MRGGFSWVLAKYMMLVATAALGIMIVGSIAFTFIVLHLHPNYEETDWSWTEVIFLVVLLAGSLAAANLIGWWLGRKVVMVLLSIGEVAQKIAAGDFKARVATEGKGLGEFGQVTGNVNRMAELLESAELELKYQNSAIAHELRTPLTILRGRLQGLRDGVFPPSDELFDSLIGHVDAMTGIVEDLRILALSNAGRLDMQLEPGDLAEEVATTVGSIRTELDRAGIRVELDLDPVELPFDKSRIRQSILAIADNAMRYAPGSTMAFSTRRSGNNAVLRCSDSGPGMSSTELECAFERFWRADESRSRASGGTGLGLSVARAIAIAHDGTARAFPSEAGGVTIELTLPIKPAALRPA